MKRFTISTSILLLFFSISTTQFLYGQSLTERYKQYGEVIISSLSSAPFPHQKRMSGHTYNNKSYSFEEHYNDSTVLIFIPKGYKSEASNNFVIHFHGWYNNVDSVLSQFKLIEQFSESKKNAILIVPQGPKDVPDSFGGKLEEKDGFKNLINEVTEFLYQKKIINAKSIGRILLSGHSGGYRVISFILMRSGLTDKIKEVFLFDGLYGQIEKYTYWLDHYNGKFINIFTKDGGTKEQSENLMDCLTSWEISFISRNENELSTNDLKNNRLIFIYSDLEHNDVINVRSQFKRFLEASCLDDL